MDKFQAFGKNITSSITPFTNRTQQYLREQFGQTGGKTELPAEYIELAKRVDALKLVHQKLLSVTNQYSTESYDYPPNIRESFNDLGRTISDKVTLLSTSTSASEAAHALTAPPSAKPQPKTFSHAIARACLAGSQALVTSHNESGAATSGGNPAGEDPLAIALEKIALAEEKVGEARLTQDQAIQSRVLTGWNTTLHTNIMFATRARRSVENSRLLLDGAKSKDSANPALGHVSDEKQREIETIEDEFVAQTEEAVGVMKNVLDTPEPLRCLKELVENQWEFHRRAMEILEEVRETVGELQVEQEASYRKNREGA